MAFDVDIQENVLKKHYPTALKALLVDHTTHGNIYWATDSYVDREGGDGYGYNFFDQIQIAAITGDNGNVIRPRAVKSRNEQTKRVKDKAFDLIMLNLQLSTIEEDHETQRNACQVKLIKIASLLEQKASIPQVLGKMNTIKEVQTEEYWQELSLSKLERVRGELRDLVKFITGTDSQTFVVNIKDIVQPAAGGNLPIDTTMTYKQKVLDYLKENSDSPVLKKIYNLEQLDESDINELERVLWQELGSKEDYDHYVAGSPFGGNVAAFIRRTMNFDYGVAMKKFQEFVQTEDLNSQQIEYLHSILAYVSEYGDILAEKMAETAPFNEFDWLSTFGDKISSVANYIRALHKVITAA